MAAELLLGAVSASCSRQRNDLPPAALMGQIEKIPAAVVELAVYEEVKWRPHHGYVVVDADLRIVNAFFDVSGSGSGYAMGETLDGDLAEVAFLHQDEHSAGEPGSLDGVRITMGHAIEHHLYRLKAQPLSLFPRSTPAMSIIAEQAMTKYKDRMGTFCKRV